jgi:hypothetical protein
MPIRLEVTPPDGLVRTVLLDRGRTQVVASPAEQYRLVGEPGEIPASVRVKRINNALVVEGLPGGDELEISNFFGACGPGRDCALLLEVPGATPATVTNETLPIAALSDGSFLLYGTAENALPVAAATEASVATSGGGLSPGLAAAGLAAVVGIGAGLGGGGGGDEESTAVPGATGTAPPAGTPTTPPETPPPATPPATPPAPPDTTRPSVTITDDFAGNVANRPVTFTFRFDEPVTGFTATDVVVTGGTKGALVALPDGLGYTIAVTPNAGVPAGQITVDLAAGAVTDAAGNANTAATRATQSYDTAPPVLTITDDAPGVVNRPTTFTFTFNEAVTDFSDADIVVAGGSRGGLTAAPDGRSFTMVVTPSAGTGVGEITIDVPAGAVSDAAGNASAAVRATQAFDLQPPTQQVASFTVADNTSPRRGDLVFGEPTNETNPTITLTLDAALAPGEVLTIVRDGSVVRTVTTGQGTNFVDGPLSAGGTTHAYTASIIDAAGNGSLLDLNGPFPGNGFAILVV